MLYSTYLQAECILSYIHIIMDRLAFIVRDKSNEFRELHMVLISISISSIDKMEN